MTYVTIDTKQKQAKLFLEYIKTLSFVKVHNENEPNATTLQAMADIKEGKTRRHKNVDELIAHLNK
jgi:hypothetical protein